MDLKNKLNNIPHVYYLNLDNREDRKRYMERQFLYWGIKNYTRVSTSNFLASKSKEWSHLIYGEVKNIPAYVVGTAISHFEVLKNWLNTTNDEYVILMEDDYDLNLIRYWHFDWRKFFWSSVNQTRLCTKNIRLTYSRRKILFR